MGYLEILVELIIGYFALFITVKCLGKTQISQITPFDFISALVLGDLVSGAVFEEHISTCRLVQFNPWLGSFFNRSISMTRKST